MSRKEKTPPLTRATFELLILESGIFKTEKMPHSWDSGKGMPSWDPIRNRSFVTARSDKPSDATIPVGVYGLTGEYELKKRGTVECKNPWRLFSDLNLILSKWLQPNNAYFVEDAEIKQATAETAKELQRDLVSLFSRYLPSCEDAEKFALRVLQELPKHKLARMLEQKIRSSYPFDDPKTIEKERKYSGLIVPLSWAFKKHLALSLNKIDWYTAHLLVKCGIEPPEVKDAYQRISRLRKRKEQTPWRKSYRESPPEI